ncbi:hypothetical protein AeMF1_007797 [Aphanomyces euteiches]|nr:hypothetical protein AeMF1_007797 [Aphanomyces euteiches]
MRIGLTTDMWTSIAKRGYMVVTLHYIDTAWQMRSVIIAFKRVMYPHTGERLARHLLEGVEEMSPRLLPCLWCITGDNASTNTIMVAAINRMLPEFITKYQDSTVDQDAESLTAPYNRLYQMWQGGQVILLRCFAHTLQLAVKVGLSKCPAIDAAIGHFRDIAKKIIDSPKLLEALHAVSSTVKIKPRVLELDVPTRWNSTWSMVSTILALKPAIIELLRRIRNGHDGFVNFVIGPKDHLARDIAESMWSALEDFCAFLKTFKDATVVMSASKYPTLGLIVPLMVVIKQRLSDAVNTCAGYRCSHTAAFAQAIQNKLMDYDDLIQQPVVKIAAALDPRTKDFADDRDTIENCLVIEWETNFASRYVAKIESGSIPPGGNSFVDPSNDILATLDSLFVRSQTTCEPFASEARRWIAHPYERMNKSDEEVLQWMRYNCQIYPRIAFMAREYLGLTSTSVPSESAFSMAGQTVDKRRTQLGDDSIEMIPSR